MCSSKGWMSGRSEWGVPGHASTELCNEGGFHVHPVPLDGSMQLGAGASLGATPKQGTSPDAPSAPRVPAAVRGFGVDKRQSYLNSWRGSGLTAWAGVSDSSDDAGVGESSHSLFTAWGGSLCSIRSLVVRELKASAVPRTAGLSTSGKPEAVAAEAATEMYTVAWQTQGPLETALPHPGGVLSAEPGAWTAGGLAHRCSLGTSGRDSLPDTGLFRLPFGPACGCSVPSRPSSRRPCPEWGRKPQ